MKNVIVIGGGPAGMSAAIAAADNSNKVTLLEANEKLGKKIYITGKGRCNYSNNAPVEEYFSNIVSNPKFMYSALYGFTPEDFTRFLNENGCKTKEERGKRLFPLSDHASDVTAAFSRAMRDRGIEVLLNTKVASLDIDEGVCRGVILSDGTKIKADHVVIATGGLSYPTTGSTGDGHRFAKESGHSLSDIGPALVPLKCEGDICKRLQGLSLKNVELTIALANDKVVFREFGEMLFTHFGISGPIVLSASSRAGKYIEEGGAHALIDYKPAIERKELDERLLRIISEHPKRSFSHFFDKLVPSKLIGVMTELSGIDPDKNLADISKDERKRILNLLKCFRIEITGTGGYNEAIVTRGGVGVKQIDPKTMMSKKVKGLSFAGEVIDIDALTGGFNIQCAVSMGFLAGGSI